MKNYLDIDNFELTFTYDSSEDSLAFVTSRPLLNGDIVLLLCNIYGMLNPEDREIATTISLKTLAAREEIAEVITDVEEIPVPEEAPVVEEATATEETIVDEQQV